MDKAVEVRIESCTFTGINSTLVSAVSVASATLDALAVVDSSFVGNGPGPALFVEDTTGGPVTVEGSDFSSNGCAIQVESPFVLDDRTALTLRRSRFLSNACDSAAAVSVLNANVAVDDCLFTRNENDAAAAGLGVRFTNGVLDETAVTIRDTGTPSRIRMMMSWPRAPRLTHSHLPRPAQTSWATTAPWAAARRPPGARSAAARRSSRTCPR